MTSFFAGVEKDLRRAWPLMLACLIVWAVLLGYTLFGASSDWSDFGDRWQLSLLYPCRWILIAVTVFLVVQSDNVVSERADWHTRPIGGMALLLSKLTGLVIGVVAPALALDAVAAFFLDVTGSELFWTVVGSAGILLAVLVVLSAVAARTRTLTQAIVVSVGGYVAFLVGAWVLAKLGVPWLGGPGLMSNNGTWFEPPVTFATDRVMSVAVTAIGPVTAITLGVAALAWLYTSKSRGLGGLMGALAAGAFFIGPSYWKGQYLSEPAGLSETPLDTKGLSVGINRPLPVKLERKEERLGKIGLNILLMFSGVPPACGIVWRSDSIRLRGENGVLALDQAMGRLIATSDSIRVRDAAVGLPSKDSWTTHPSVGEFWVDPSDFVTISGRPQRIEGTLRVTPYHFQVVQRLPLVIGREKAKSGRRWNVIRYSAGSGAAGRVVLERINVASNAALEALDMRFALLNERQREIATSLATQNSVFTLDMIHAQRLDIQFEPVRGMDDGVTRVRGPEWMRDAVLLVLIALPCAERSLPLLEERIDIPALAEATIARPL